MFTRAEDAKFLKVEVRMSVFLTETERRFEWQKVYVPLRAIMKIEPNVLGSEDTQIQIDTKVFSWYSSLMIVREKDEEIERQLRALGALA